MTTLSFDRFPIEGGFIKPFEHSLLPIRKLKTNSYVVTKDESCIVIDPGEHPAEMIHLLGGRNVDSIL